jgi:4-alpha-glucanotransferase
MSSLNLSAYLSNTASKDKWEKIGMRKRSGILVPLFSIYSKKSVGIGELEDLKLLIDWAAKTGNSIVQLLPMNEVGAIFCPYDSVSSFAIEPAYISLKSVVYPKQKVLRDKIENIKKVFPAGNSHVDYRLKKEKVRLLWDIYFKQDFSVSREFRQFREENSYWINDFGLFMVLKDYHQGKPWYEWEEGYKNRDAARLTAFRQEYEREINFQIWVQWLAFKQFKDVKAHAVAKKVLIKGDLPILVSRDSADVWAHPEFFKLEFAAGAPPDMYCAKGQRWGMPPYNWQEILADDCRYLKEKLKYAENFYDILRIDHVVGLFRIWSIPYSEPLENRGLNGFFDPADKNKWGEHGRKILRIMLKHTDMLLCAEDLGTVPKDCPRILEDLGIPGNDIQRWVKDWKTRHDFLSPEEYRVLSVAMLSTHDTTNWPAWWENEAGTVDEALFIRKCAERGIDYHHVKEKLFDIALSRHGRVRWLTSVNSVDLLTTILGKRQEEIMDFIDMYKNSFQEKEKLWKHLKISGPMREKADNEILTAVVKITLESRAIFCIQLISDWLYLVGIFKADAYQYRINNPGTISADNWSLVMPIPLEDLLKHKVNKNIRQMIISSGRI